MSGKKNRKRWIAAEKMRIVLAGMEPGVEVSDLCRQEGLNPKAVALSIEETRCKPAKRFDLGTCGNRR